MTTVSEPQSCCDGPYCNYCAGATPRRIKVTLSGGPTGLPCCCVPEDDTNGEYWCTLHDACCGSACQWDPETVNNCQRASFVVLIDNVGGKARIHVKFHLLRDNRVYEWTKELDIPLDFMAPITFEGGPSGGSPGDSCDMSNARVQLN